MSENSDLPRAVPVAGSPERSLERIRPKRMHVQLSRLLAARLCHDLGGLVGTLSGTLDLAGEEPGEQQDDMLALACETAAALRQRLRLCAAAWGEATEDADAGTLTRLLEASPAASRVRFALKDLAPGGRLPAALVPLALNAALLAAEALPRGGTVTLAGSDAAGLLVQPDGRDAAWPAGLPGLLAGDAAAPQGGPRRVLAPLLLALVAEAGWTAALGQTRPGGVPPLLLARA
jgi:histidine phosphotransferase ChpT